MRMKKLLFGLMACGLLLAVSCEPNNTSDEDTLYKDGVEKSDISI